MFNITVHSKKSIILVRSPGQGGDKETSMPAENYEVGILPGV